MIFGNTARAAGRSLVSHLNVLFPAQTMRFADASDKTSVVVLILGLTMNFSAIIGVLSEQMFFGSFSSLVY